MKLTITAGLAAAERQLQATLRRTRQAVADGVREGTQDLKEKLRAEVRAAGLGDRLSRSWRSAAYPNEGFNAAGLVYSNAPKLIRVFSEGALIRPVNGFFLAIPTPEAPRRGTDGRKITPDTWPVNRFGPLRFVYRATGPCLLVADNLRGSYARETGQLRGFRKATEKAVQQGRTATVVMFFLIRKASLRRRLSPEQIVRGVAESMPGRVVRRLEGGAG